MKKDFAEKRVTLINSHINDSICTRYANILAENGFEVNIITAAEKESINKGISTISIKKRANSFSIRDILKQCLKFKGGAYIILSPDLFFLGLLLKISCAGKVIYCVLENQEFQYKKGLAQKMGRAAYSIFYYLKSSMYNIFDLVIFADDKIMSKFKNLKKKVLIRNYPDISKEQYDVKEITADETTGLDLVYNGLISKENGLYKMRILLQNIDVGCNIHLYGPLENEGLKYIIDSHPGFIYHGTLPVHGIVEELIQYDAAICLSETDEGIEDNNNIFGYMFAELPIIASDNGISKKIIIQYNCGMLVNLEDSDEIIKSIRYLYFNRNKGQIWGKNARKALFEKLNWSIEGRKLVDAINIIL